MNHIPDLVKQEKESFYLFETIFHGNSILFRGAGVLN